MTENKFDPDWPHGHVTRDGRKARIICTDRRRKFPIVALLDNGQDERLSVHYPDGRAADCASDTDDLKNAPAPKRRITGWMNVYCPSRNHDAKHRARAVVCASKEVADQEAASDRIACIYVDFEEGDGL